MAKQCYEVIVSNIGRVWYGNDAFTANTEYNAYVGKSKRNEGRAAGESVDMYRNGELVKSFIGSLKEQEMRE